MLSVAKLVFSGRHDTQQNDILHNIFERDTRHCDIKYWVSLPWMVFMLNVVAPTKGRHDTQHIDMQQNPNHYSV
jgi:hypothetical protein